MGRPQYAAAMAAGAGGVRNEHDAHDRAFLVGLLIVLGLLGAGVALVHRQGMAHSSQAGDACPVTARGGLVGYDARTGAVRWTNVVPPEGRLAPDPESGKVRLLRPASYVDGLPDRFLMVTREIDPATGRVTACSGVVEDLTQAEQNALNGYDEPLATPMRLDGMLISKWGDGIRATDGTITGTGLWGIPHGQARVRIGDALVVTGSGDGRARTHLLDLRTGETRWSVREKLINAPRAGDPVITADPTHSREITAHDLTTGQVLWTGLLPPGSHASEWRPAYAEKGLAIVPVGDGSEIAALDLATGRVRWQADGGSPGRNGRFSEPGEVADVVLAPEGDIVIVAVNAERPPEYD